MRRKKFTFTITATFLIPAVFSVVAYFYPIYTARLLPFLPSIERLPLTGVHHKTVRSGENALLIPTDGYVPLQDIPVSLQKAVIATEDKRFYEHRGIDFHGIARAFYADITSHGYSEGGSTITQQLARNLFLNQSQTISRKLTEAFLALQLENYYSKDTILEMYLNNIYYGRGAYGIKEAAKVYFGKRDVSSLNVYQSAYLAGLPQSPTYYAKNLEAAYERELVILRNDGMN